MNIFLFVFPPFEYPGRPVGKYHGLISLPVFTEPFFKIRFVKSLLAFEPGNNKINDLLVRYLSSIQINSGASNIEEFIGKTFEVVVVIGEIEYGVVNVS